MDNPLVRNGHGAGAVALGLLAMPLTLAALLIVAPDSNLTEAVWKPLLVASGPAIPVAVLLSLVALGQGARGRAVLALVLFVPALAGPLLAVRKARKQAPVAAPAPAPAPPPRPAGK